MAYLRFPTTALRESFRFSPRHVGREVYDAQEGNLYVVTAAGSGAGVMDLLDGGGGGGPPDAHAASHENGGGDDLDVRDLDGYGAEDDTTYLRGDRVFATPNVLALSGYPGGTTSFLRADGSFAVPPGSLGVYMPDVPPASPHASDNEFTSALGGTEIDHPNIATWSIDATRKRAQVAVNNTGDSQSGLYVWDVPAGGEFSCISKVGALVLPATSRVFDAGIVVAEGTGINDNFVLMSSYQFRDGTGVLTAWGVRGQHFSDHDTVVGDADLGPQQDQRSYMRIAVNGNDVILYSSVDGQNWYFHYATADIGWTPTKMGLGFWHAGTFGVGQVAQAHWDFFRVASGAGTSGPAGHQIGAYV